MNAKTFKKAAAAFIFSVAGLLLFSQEQNSSRQYIRRTEHFDIVYFSPCERSAALIEKNIERMYLECRKRNNATEYKDFRRFPIFLKYDYQSLNAYYANTPFHHIVVYDTLPKEDLSVFDSNLLEVLDHELTHAVTLNKKDRFNQIISDIFTDSWNGFTFSGTKNVIEGMTVFNESRDGLQGRLNDPYSMHILKQAKKDGLFPSWEEVTGGRDIYPSGNVPYIFGGAFTAFLVNKYGADKYYKYWDSLVMYPLWYFYSYDRYFDTSIDSDWQEFIAGIDISALKDVPNSAVCEFPLAKTSTQINSVTSWLSVQSGGVAWIDSALNSVYYSIRKPDSDTEFLPPEKLFTLNGIDKITFSRDGRFLAVSYQASYSEVKARTGIYDLTLRRFIAFDADGYRDPCILLTDTGYKFCAVKVMGQKTLINVCDLVLKANSVKYSTQMRTAIEFQDNTVALSLCDYAAGRLSFLKREGMKQFLCLCDTDFSNYSCIEIPNDIKVNNLSSVNADFITNQKGCLFTFSYGTTHRVPSLGFLSLKFENAFEPEDECTVYLQNEEFSGAVWYTAASPASKSRKLPSVVYSARFFDSSRLYLMDTDQFSFATRKLPVTPALPYTAIKEIEPDISGRRILNPFEAQRYWFPGSLLPLGSPFIYDNQFNLTDIAFLGLTWFGRNFTASAGWAPFSNSYGARLVFNGQSETQNASYNVESNVLFDPYGFKQTTLIADVQASVPVGKHSYFTFYDKLNFFYGYSNQMALFKFEAQKHENLSLNAANQFGINYLSSVKTGRGYYQKLVFGFGPFFTINYIAKNLNNLTGREGGGYSPGVQLFCSLPQILPFESPQGYTCNLPLDVSIAFFPAIDRFMSLNATLVLFSAEIQKGTGHFAIPLYFNRASLSATYRSGYYYNHYITAAIADIPSALNSLSYYSDQIGIKLDLFFKFNSGMLGSYGPIDFAAEFLFDVNTPFQRGFHIKLFNQLVF